MQLPSSICFCIEGNHLEKLGLLLVASLREFGELPPQVTIFGVNPRLGTEVSNETRSMLDKHEIRYVRADLNVTWKDHGLANKIYAAAFVEEEVAEKAEKVLFLDTDILCLGPLTGLLATNDFAFAGKPVDIKGVGRAKNEPLGPLWQGIADEFGLCEDLFTTVRSTFDEQLIRAYFNSGVLIARSERRFFCAAREAMENGVLRNHFDRLDRTERYYFEQVVLSCAASRLFHPQERHELSEQFNFPLHLRKYHSRSGLLHAMPNLLHHHGDIFKAGWHQHIALSADVRQWLIQHALLLE